MIVTFANTEKQGGWSCSDLTLLQAGLVRAIEFGLPLMLEVSTAEDGETPSAAYIWATTGEDLCHITLIDGMYVLLSRDFNEVATSDRLSHLIANHTGGTYWGCLKNVG